MGAPTNVPTTMYGISSNYDIFSMDLATGLVTAALSSDASGLPAGVSGQAWGGITALSGGSLFVHADNNSDSDWHGFTINTALAAASAVEKTVQRSTRNIPFTSAWVDIPHIATMAHHEGTDTYYSVWHAGGASSLQAMTKWDGNGDYLGTVFDLPYPPWNNRYLAGSNFGHAGTCFIGDMMYRTQSGPGQFHRYNVATNSFGGQSWPPYHATTQPFFILGANAGLLVFQRRDGQIAIYDPDAITWDVTYLEDTPLGGMGSPLAVYDPSMGAPGTHNIHSPAGSAVVFDGFLYYTTVSGNSAPFTVVAMDLSNGDVTVIVDAVYTEWTADGVLVASDGWSSLEYDPASLCFVTGLPTAAVGWQIGSVAMGTA